MSECNALFVQNVSKSFSKTQVLKQITLTAKKGEVTGVLGRNGCGKSVLLKCILGLYRIDQGEIKVGEELVKGVPPKTPIGFLIDGAGFLPDETAMKNLKYIASIRNITQKQEWAQILQMVGLDPLLKTKVRYYSTGMKQRLGLAMCLLEDPPVLLLDEPFSALDQASIVCMRTLICAQAKKGKIVVMTSHNQEDIQSMCDKKYTIIDGLISEN